MAYDSFPDPFMEKRTALLIGATGLVGSALLPLLLEDERYGLVRVMARHSTGMESPKLEERLLDFEDLESHIGELAVDDVYCAMGSTLSKAGSFEAAFKAEFLYPYQIAQLALYKGASRFVLCSSTGANLSSGNYYLRTKGRLEKDLSELNYPETHLLRPSFLLGEREERRPLEEAGQWAVTQFENFVPKRYRAVEALSVASFMVSAAFSGRKGVNVYENEEVREGSLDAPDDLAFARFDADSGAGKLD